MRRLRRCEKGTGSGTSAAGPSRRAAAAGFDFTSQIKVLCADIVARLPEFGHVDLARVAFSFSQARKRGRYGLHATLTPMRFEGGALVGKRRGANYTVQRLVDASGREMLYILSFYLPRFMDLEFTEKLTTIFHELWHISPDFNGDVRRHPGRCYAHTSSQTNYDAAMGRLADRWLGLSPPEPLYAFLRGNFTELQRRYGRVWGVKIPHPKLIPAKGSLTGPNKTGTVSELNTRVCREST